MATPDTITIEQVREALTTLGLGEDFSRTRQVVIDPKEVTVTRYQVRGDANIIVPGTNAIATETEAIRVVPA